MRTKRLWIGSLSITLILSLMCSLLLLFPSQRVQAETSIEDKCAQYTSRVSEAKWRACCI